MGKLLHLRGLQLVITFLPVYKDGGYSQDVFRVGPFWNAESLQDWQKLFIDYFQGEFEAEEDITECTIPSAEIETYDPNDFVVSPEDPLLIAQEVLDIMLQSVVREYPDDTEGPFLWKALIRLEMAGGGFSLDAMVVSGPFVEREDILPWCTPFIQSVKQRASQVKGVKVELLDEHIVAERRYVFDDDECLLNASHDPKIGGQRFFSDFMQGLIAACNFKV
jgi:hypothetical protein